MDDSSIIRYEDLFVTPIVTDETLAKAYFMMKSDGSFDKVFYQGNTSLTQFLTEFLTVGRRITLGAFRDVAGKEPELCGLGWVLAPVSMDGWQRTETGMWFSQEQSRKTDNVRFGRMMLHSFFTRYTIDVIFGCTPSQNRAALIYARKLGFFMNGPIMGMCSWDGKLSSGWISTMTQEHWLTLPPFTS